MEEIDQTINGSIKRYDEVIKVSTGQGDDCATGCLLDYAYFKDNCRLIAVDLSKQKALDADQEQFNKYYFKELVDGLITQEYDCTLFLKNQQKESSNFTKEQQKFCKNI